MKARPLETSADPAAGPAVDPADRQASLEDLAPMALVPTLWLACSSAELGAVEWLVDRCGMGAVEIAQDEHRAYRLACASNAIDLAEWLVATFSCGTEAMRARDCEAFRHACRRGSTRVVEMIGPHLDPDEVRVRDFEVLWTAAAGGHLDVLLWIHSQNDVAPEEVHAQDDRVLRAASDGEHADVVRWLAGTFYPDGQPPVQECLARLEIH